ncbi:MAG: GNAT family N-acetyltransferase, partial [Ralstonia sp.]
MSSASSAAVSAASASAIDAVVIRPANLVDLPAIVLIYAHNVRTGTASFEIDPPDL